MSLSPSTRNFRLSQVLNSSVQNKQKTANVPRIDNTVRQQRTKLQKWPQAQHLQGRAPQIPANCCTLAKYGDSDEKWLSFKHSFLHWKRWMTLQSPRVILLTTENFSFDCDLFQWNRTKLAGFLRKSEVPQLCSDVRTKATRTVLPSWMDNFFAFWKLWDRTMQNAFCEVS